MNRIIKAISMATAIFIATSIYGHAAGIGKPAPDFTLKDTYGVRHKLSDLKGEYIVLEWFNPDCPFVRKHYDSGNMQALQKKYTDKGVIWLTINSSAPGKQGHYSPEEFNNIIKERKAHQSYLLLDVNGKVGRLYGAKTTPHIFIINKQGRLVYNGAIDSIASVNQRDLPKAENYVEMVFNNLSAGKKVSPHVTRPYGCSVKY